MTRPRQVQRSVAAVSAGSGRQAKPVRQRQLASEHAGQPLDGNAQQHEIDVGIDRRARPPDPLQDEGAQRRRILAIGVERLDRRQVRLVAQALAERQPPLRRAGESYCRRSGIATVSVSSSAMRPCGHQAQDRRRGEQHLGQRGQVEPRAAVQRRGFRFALRQTEYLDGAVAGCR